MSEKRIDGWMVPRNWDEPGVVFGAAVREVWDHAMADDPLQRFDAVTLVPTEDYTALVAERDALRRALAGIVTTASPRDWKRMENMARAALESTRAHMEG